VRSIRCWPERAAQTWRAEPHPALRLLVIIASITAVAVYLFVALRRIRYPYELEWMEGGMVDHVARLMRGQPLYVRPSLEFTPFIYPPLYYCVSAGAARIFGLGFFPLRFVSLVCSLGAFVLTAAIVRRETRCWTAAAASVGVLAASFPASGAWFDVGRVDSLLMLLLLSTLWIVLRLRNVYGACAAALVLSLAFLTKQSALVFAPAAALILVLSQVRLAVLFASTFAVLVVASAWMLDRVTDGWYGFYTFAVVRGHAIVHEMHAVFWLDELLRPCAFGVMLTVAFAMAPRVRSLGSSRAPLATAIAALILMSWLSRVHSGGWLNVLIPAHTAVALGSGLGLHALLDQPDHSSARRFAWLGAIMLLLQLAVLAYDPRRFLPTAADKAEGDRFINRLRNLPGDVLLTHHGYLPTLAGKRTFAHHMAVIDVMRSTADVAQSKQALHEEFEAALREHRFTAIVIDNADPPFLPSIEWYYRRESRWPYGSQDTWFPRTGAHIRPDLVFVPRDR
jgi:4-amino-4-deoxy-L-arabinose transferase-like glycosyltransferase